MCAERRDSPEVTREVRPDWDLGTPGLREPCEAGDRSGLFHDEHADPSLRAV